MVWLGLFAYLMLVAALANENVPPPLSFRTPLGLMILFSVITAIAAMIWIFRLAGSFVWPTTGIPASPEELSEDSLRKMAEYYPGAY